LVLPDVNVLVYAHREDAESHDSGFTEQLHAQPNCARVEPGLRHLELFRRLCRECGAKGNLVPDAYFAALAIESDCEWITTDRDYSRFKGLRWRHPLP
jgi:predicted nucleic acid-binding protein